MGVFDKAFEGYDVVRKGGQDAKVYGKVNGFYFSAVQVPALSELVITINYKTDDYNLKQEIVQVFNNLKAQNKKLKHIEIKDYCLVIHQQVEATKKMVALLENVTKQMTQFLSIKGAGSGCGLCGSEGAEFYSINNNLNCLCPNCSNEIVGRFEQNVREKMMNKSKFVPGLIGAFVGSLIGVALWILIYKMGYIAGIAGAVAIICAMKGWEMLGGALDVKGIICSFVLSLVMIYFGHQIAVTWELVDAFKEIDIKTDFFEVYKNMGEILEWADATGEYWSDLIIGYLLTIVVGISFVVNAFKEAKGSYSMKKM